VASEKEATSAIHFASEAAKVSSKFESQVIGSRITDKKPMMVIGATLGATRTLNRTLRAEISPERKRM